MSAMTYLKIENTRSSNLQGANRHIGRGYREIAPSADNEEKSSKNIEKKEKKESKLEKLQKDLQKSNKR